MYLFHNSSRHSGWETMNCELEESCANNQRLANAAQESKSVRQTNSNKTDNASCA